MTTPATENVSLNSPAWPSVPRTLYTGTNGQTVKFAYPLTKTKFVRELGVGTERQMETEFAFDNYGNQTLEANYGVVVNGDRSAFDDERIATNEFDPRALARREETGQGMGATLNVAEQKGAYTLADRGTYLSLRRRLALVILSQGDASLRNNYHAYAVNPARHPRARRAEARAFIDFLVSDGVPRTIATFKRDELGESLFFPDALAPRSTR